MPILMPGAAAAAFFFAIVRSFASTVRLQAYALARAAP
jgi:hypothetical protein